MTEEEISKWAKKLIQRYDNVKIVGAGGEWSGDSRRGFMFNPRPVSVPVTTPPSVTGACCPDVGDCFISTQSICESGGGTYQGDGTTCDPDPCPPKGACCVGTDCTIETATDCTGMGGTYQGDDTVCDPNPCELPPCCAGAFDAFDGSGRKFHTKTTVTIANESIDTSAGCSESYVSTSSWSSTRVDTIDPNTCEATCLCSGSGAFDYNIGFPDCATHFEDSGSTVSGGCVGFDFCESNFSISGYETMSGCEVSGSSRPFAHGCFNCGGTSTVNSATSETIHYACDTSMIEFFHGTVEITLSDECTP